MAERSNAAVLKTVEGHTSGGSNPSPSAKASQMRGFFFTLCPIIYEPQDIEWRRTYYQTREPQKALLRHQISFIYGDATLTHLAFGFVWGFKKLSKLAGRPFLIPKRPLDCDFRAAAFGKILYWEKTGSRTPSAITSSLAWTGLPPLSTSGYW